MLIPKFKLENLVVLLNSLTKMGGLGYDNSKMLLGLYEAALEGAKPFMDTKNALIQEKGTKIEGTGDYSIEGNDEALAEVKAMADEEMDFSYPVKVTLNLDPNSPWISASVLKTFFDVLGNDGFEIVAPASSTVATAMPMQAGGNCASGQCNAPAQAAGMKQDGTYTGDKAYKKTPAQK